MQNTGFGAGFGFDPSATGGFAGMDVGGDINQMQQMQMMMAMQNGMGSNSFGNFPMMGTFVAVANCNHSDHFLQECLECLE